MTLVLAAAAVLVVMVLSAVAMVQVETRRRLHLVEDRIDTVTLAYRPSRFYQASARRPIGDVGTALRRRWEALLGYRPARRQHYRTSFRRVSVLALCPALGACYFLTRVAGQSGWLAFPVIWIGMVRFYYSSAENRLGARLYMQFPDALAMIVRAVRVGVPVTEAVRMVSLEGQAPTSVEFRQLTSEISIGVPLEAALRDMGARNRLPEYRFFATALALQSQTGGGLTETLETLADTIRKRVAAKSRGHALASEARTSCYVLAVLPLIVAAGLYATDPAYISVLFTTSAGNRLLFIGIGLLSFGLYTMRTIIRRSLS